MKNIIEFYYNVKINTIHGKDDYYTFTINNQNYIFKPYYKDERTASSCYRLNSMLSNKIPLNNIIPNKYNSPITIIDNISYILLENRNKNNISLPAISNISNTPITNTIYIQDLERNNWETLWSEKIDYYEIQIGENRKKYPLIRESFDYFIGMGEIAISYLVNTKLEEKPTIYDNKVPAHNSILNSLYDPSNFILDHKARDLAEYIKYSFWHNNHNIFNELNEYFSHNFFSVYGIRVLFARIMYPSFYFYLYDDIITEKKEEQELNTIISRINEYECFLYNIYLYLNKFYNIPEIAYIKKQGTNPHLQL